MGENLQGKTVSKGGMFPCDQLKNHFKIECACLV